ncbi:MAG TPA: hypothetical protein VKP11_08470 [Frankiaceae bacterium]|nr:hypothetical protein [Frankiaceae bacterium]
MRTVIAVVEPDTIDVVVRWAYEEALGRGWDLRLVQDLARRPAYVGSDGAAGPQDGGGGIRLTLERMRAAADGHARQAGEWWGRRPTVSFHLISRAGRLDAVPLPASRAPHVLADAEDVIVVAEDPRTGATPVLPPGLAGARCPTILLHRHLAPSTVP